MIKLLPTPVAVPLSHYNSGPLRQHRWQGSIKPKGSSEHSFFSLLQQVQILKTRSLYQRQPKNSSFTPKSLTLLCIWKHWMKKTAFSITTHTGQRKEGRACISLPIRAGTGMLEKLSVKLHHKPGYMKSQYGVTLYLTYFTHLTGLILAQWDELQKSCLFSHMYVTTPSHPPN